MLATIIERLYTGFFSRDLVHIVFGGFPLYVLYTLDPTRFVLFSRLSSWMQFPVACTGAYLLGFLLQESFAIPKIVKTNPKHGYCSTHLRRVEKFIARGDTSLNNTLKESYYTLLILLETKGYPLRNLERIVFLKHLTGSMAPSLLVGFFLLCSHTDFIISLALIFFAFLSIALNWYFWRFQFTTVDQLCYEAGLYGRPSMLPVGPQ